MLLDQTTNANNMQQLQYQQQAFVVWLGQQQQQLQQQPQIMLKVRRSGCKCVVCRVEYDGGK